MEYPNTDFDQLFAQARARNTNSANTHNQNRPNCQLRNTTHNDHAIQRQTQRPRIAAQSHHLGWHGGENYDHLFDSGSFRSHGYWQSSPQARHSSNRHSRNRRRRHRPHYERQRSQSMDETYTDYNSEDPFEAYFQRACQIQDGRPREQRVRYGRQVSHSADEIDDIEIRLNDSPLESPHTNTSLGRDDVDNVFVPPPTQFSDNPEMHFSSDVRPISPISRLLASHTGEDFDTLFTQQGAYSIQATDYIGTSHPHPRRHSVCIEADSNTHSYLETENQNTHSTHFSQGQGQCQGQRTRSNSYHGYTDAPPSYEEVINSSPDNQNLHPHTMVDTDPPPNYEQSLFCPKVTIV